MKTLQAELPKISGSFVWLVTVGLPMLSVLSGAIGDLSISDWDTLWLRSIGFYGMALLSVGIAILASLTWRLEHKNGNWNLLMSQPVSNLSIISAKAIVIALLAATMQVVLLITVCFVGKIGLDLSGLLPARYWLSSVLVILGCVPVAVLQSLLSMVLRSFAVPVAIALVGTGLSTAILMTGSPIILLSPYALATYSTQMGTSLVGSASTVFHAAALTPNSAGTLIIIVLALTAMLLGGTTMLLNRRDIHA